MAQPSAFDIDNYKYQLPKNSIVGKRGPRLAGPMYSMGNATGDSINVLGAHRRPDGGLIGELDTSTVYDNIRNDSYNKGLPSKEVANNMTKNVSRPIPGNKAFTKNTDDAMANIRRLKVEGEFSDDVGEKGSPAFGGYYEGEHKAKIAMDRGIDSVANTFSHEANHGLETDPYNWDVKWGDNSNELMSSIAGYRHGFDKEMMKEVHPYIDFKNGRFNTNPAKEFIRRRGVEGNTNSKMNAAELKSYMSKLNTEADRLNEKYKADNKFSSRMDIAEERGADVNNKEWRNASAIKPESSFFEDVATLFR